MNWTTLIFLLLLLACPLAMLFMHRGKGDHLQDMSGRSGGPDASPPAGAPTDGRGEDRHDDHERGPRRGRAGKPTTGA